MATYVSLAKLTCEGFRQYKQGRQRWQEAKAAIEAAGGKILGAYAVMGPYDFIFITDFPDERRATSAILKASSSGEINFQTMTAIPIEDFHKLAEQL